MPSLVDLIRGDSRPEKQPLGYSPDQMEDWLRQYGSAQKLQQAVLSARYGEQGADPKLTALSPEDRAALDRYANFALTREQSSGPLASAATYLGGLGAMAATEGIKYAKPAQRAVSAIWNLVQGAPADATPFFGGRDTSAPSLANIMAAHYGYTRPRGTIADLMKGGR